MQRALLSRSGWEQTAARQTQQCSPPQRMQSRFSEFPYYFSSFPFGAVGRIGLTLPQQSRRLHRQARRLGRQQGCGAKTAHRDGKRHHRRGHHLARRTARLLFWCSCIFLSHSACAASKLYSNAASRRQRFFKCHLYVYSIHPTPSSRQCPSVSRAGRFVEVPPWPTLHVENELSRRIIAPKRKKVQFRTGFLRFPLAVLTCVWYHDGHAAFAAL